MANKQDLIAKVAEATELTKKDSAAADKKPFRRRKEEALSSSRPYGRTKFFDFG